jgi:hypothetical protein
MNQYLGNREPALDQIFSDPIVRLALECDGVSPAEARARIEVARQHLRKRTGRQPKKMPEAGSRTVELAGQPACPPVGVGRPGTAASSQSSNVEDPVVGFATVLGADRPYCGTGLSPLPSFGSRLGLSGLQSDLQATGGQRGEILLALHELTERLTAVGNYLAALLELSRTETSRQPALPGSESILSRAMGQAELANAALHRLRYLSGCGGSAQVSAAPDTER